MEKKVEGLVEEKSADGVRRRERPDFDCCSPSTIRKERGLDFDKSRRNDLQGLYFGRLTSLLSVIYEKQGAIGGDEHPTWAGGKSPHQNSRVHTIIIPDITRTSVFLSISFPFANQSQPFAATILSLIVNFRAFLQSSSKFLNNLRS